MCISSGVQVGSLMPSSLASCEFAWDRVVFPRCSLPSAHGQKQMDDLNNHELLWMLTRVISGYWDHNSFFFFFLLTALPLDASLLLLISLQDWGGGQFASFLLTFLH